MLAVFLKAQEGYRKAVIKELDRMLQDARDNKNIQLHVMLTAPEDHTEDYNQVIQMLEWSIDEEVELVRSDFVRYVMDDWGWKQDFLENSSSYSTSSSISSTIRENQ